MLCRRRCRRAVDCVLLQQLLQQLLATHENSRGPVGSMLGRRRFGRWRLAPRTLEHHRVGHVAAKSSVLCRMRCTHVRPALRPCGLSADMAAATRAPAHEPCSLRVRVCSSLRVCVSEFMKSFTTRPLSTSQLYCYISILLRGRLGASSACEQVETQTIIVA